VVFECLMAFFREWFGGEQLQDLFADPHWPLWFLTALIAWRLLTPLFRSLPFPTAIALAVAVSVTSAVVDGEVSEYFDLTRAAGMLPFFVLGLHSTPERLERLRAAGVRWAAVGTFGVLWLLTGTAGALSSADWLYYSTPYAELGATDSQGIVIRLGLLATGVVGAAAFLALVPRVSGWFSRMGSATLVVYLCHGFVVRGLAYAGYPEWAEQHVAVAAVATFLGGLALALALASPPVRKRLLLVVDPFGRAEQEVKQAVDLTLEAAAPPAPGSLPAMETQPATTAAR
jgi:fucose 4-O-acetylase-like acetyltransferase